MANYATLKAAIQQVVKTNGNNEITGALLQQSLLAMINSLGANYQFVGIATPSTNPGTPDQNVFYIGGPGTYPNFDGAVVDDGKLGVFKFNGSWNNDVVSVGKNYDDAIEALEEKTETTIVHNKNLADEATLLYGYVASNGVFRPGTGVERSIKFPCRPSTTYTISKIRTTRFRVACYNVDPIPSQYPTGYPNIGDNNATAITITTPSDAQYIVAYIYNGPSESVTIDDVMASLQIEIGSVATAYVAPGWSAIDKEARAEILAMTPADNLTTDNPAIPLSAKQGVVLKQLLDTGFSDVNYNAVYENQYINGNSGRIETNTNYHRFEYDVNPGDVYLITVPDASSAVAIIAFFNGETYLPDYSVKVTGGVFIVKIPDGVTKFNICLLKTKTYSIRRSTALLQNFDISKPLRVTGDATNYRVYSGNDYIIMRRVYSSRNKNLNFSSISKNGISYDISDEITPMHVLNSTLGGNHAQPVYNATIAEHGLTAADIGTPWVHTNGNTYYVVKIVDENNLHFLSENYGTILSPTFRTLVSGTITRNGTSKTITAVSSTQMWPGIKNVSHRIIVDGVLITEQNPDVRGTVIDFVESYDIMNPASILANLIQNVGNNVNGEYDGDVAIHADITYRILAGLQRIVFTNYLVVQDGIKFSNFMFLQRTGASAAKYYTPNCSAFRVPALFSSNDSVLINASNTIKDTGKPCNRVLQYYENNAVAFAIGVITDIGVGGNLQDYTDEQFELRGGTRKIYPTPVNSNKIGNSLIAGTMYTAIMYCALFDLVTVGNRQSLYHFNINGIEYVFADYSGSTTEKISIDDSLNGKTVEVIESSNVELLQMRGNAQISTPNNIYNGGFYVNATYVQNETCYIVVKIA